MSEVQINMVMSKCKTSQSFNAGVKWAESGGLTTFGTAAYSQSFSQVSANDIQTFSARQNRAVNQ